MFFNVELEIEILDEMDTQDFEDLIVETLQQHDNLKVENIEAHEQAYCNGGA